MAVKDKIFLSFDPLLETFLNVFPNRKPVPVVQMDVKLDGFVLPLNLSLQAQVVLHFNDNFQVDRVQIEKCLINRKMLNRMETLPKLLMGAEWTHSNDNMFDRINARIAETPEEELERERYEAALAETQERLKWEEEMEEQMRLQAEKRREDALTELLRQATPDPAEAQAKVQAKVDEIRIKKKELADEGVKRMELNANPELQKLMAELKELKRAAEAASADKTPATI